VIRLAVRVPRSRAELVLAELAVLAPAGFEEREVGDLVEYAIYGAAGELPDLGELRALVGDALVDVVTTEVPDDWEERWRQWHRPLDVGPLRVRPPWEPARDGALPARNSGVARPQRRRLRRMSRARRTRARGGE